MALNDCLHLVFELVLEVVWTYVREIILLKVSIGL